MKHLFKLEITSRLNAQTLALALCSALTITACGGGGGGGGDATPVAAAPVVVADVVLSGTVATGRAWVGATVLVFDATGAQIGTATSAADGTYTITLKGGAKAPFVFSASLDNVTLYSMTSESKSGTVNITPITNLIASRLTKNGDPATLIDGVKADPNLLSLAALKAKVMEITDMLKPLLAAVGDTTDPIAGTFTAGGSTGHDKVLDSIKIVIRPTDTGTSNIDVTLITKPATDADQPTTISFAGGDKTPPAPTVTIKPADLVADNTVALIDDLMKRSIACYALPQASRVDSATTPTKLIAPECLGLFVGNDPATYLHNSAKVGPSGAFSGAFNSGVMGVTFDRGTFEFTRANGDVFATWRNLSVAKNETTSSSMLRKDTDGKLKFIGNQYAYNVTARAWLQNREFFNTPAFTYNSTGYSIAITNVTGANNLPLFSQAVVTTPAGKQIVYKPVAGRSNLLLVNPTTNAQTNTTVIRMASKYTTASTAGHPRDKEGSYLYFVDTDLTDAEFKALPDNGTWNVEFTLAATGAKVTQSHRTISRALTLGEASVFKLPNLTAAAKAAVITRSSVNGVVTFGANENVNVEWEVPVGAAAPTSMTAYGRAPVNGQPSSAGAQFDDGASFGSTARSATVNCSTLNATDVHCATPTSGFYATNATMSSLELSSLTPRFVDLSKMNALYKLQ